jgi:hypothetical protein
VHANRTDYGVCSSRTLDSAYTPAVGNSGDSATTFAKASLPPAATTIDMVVEPSRWDRRPAVMVVISGAATRCCNPMGLPRRRWIAMQGNGHVVAMAPPGSPDAATGDVIYMAEVSP